MAMDKDGLIILFNIVMDELYELKAKVALQNSEIEQLKAENMQLKAELEKLKSPPPNSTNSSMPPSRDLNKSRGKGAIEIKKRGARDGHVMMKREFVDNPDRVIVGSLKTCVCGADVSEVELERIVRRQITELPVIKPVVIETRQEVGKCRCCGRQVYGELPEELTGNGMFGPQLEATITYLQHQQHMSYERTEAAVMELFGVEMSQGGIACVSERAGQAAQERQEAITASIRASEVVGGDETGAAKIKRQKQWEWVFVSKSAILHVIRPSRGTGVILEVMGSAKVDVWVSDCWGPQLKARAVQRQLCIPHQIRNLQGLIEKAPKLRWARELQALFREAVHWSKQRAEMNEDKFESGVSELEKKLDRLLARPVTNPKAQALLERYRERRHQLFVFLHDTRVPHHNNDCERALRSSVVHRKVTGGFRSKWGADAYAAIASVVDTAKLSGTTAFAAIRGLFGKAIQHFATAEP